MLHCWESFETKDTRTMFLKVENDENMLKARAIYDKWLTMFLKLEQLRTFWNQGRYKMEHSSVIWKDVFEVGPGEKKLKARTQNGAVWRYLKRFFGSWNCLEHFESNEASWYTHMLFQGWFGSWNCLEKCKSKKAKWCILVPLETVFWKLELLRKF